MSRDLPEAAFLFHGPCESCGSSDGCAHYDDGHTYCFVCQRHTKGTGDSSFNHKGGKRRMASPDLLTDVVFQGLHARRITQETCEKYGYGIGTNKRGQKVQVAPYFDADGNLVGQKLRTKDKAFSVVGSLNDALPFGAHVWPKTGKQLVVTEGEVDALAMSQVQGNKWPVVSIPNGAQSAKKHFAKCADYYSGFDKIVLMFDADEPGRKAAVEAAEVIGTRAHIAELPMKDPAEMLAAGRTQDLINAMWRAKQYRPEGIVEISTLAEEVKKEPEQGVSWWLPSLTAATYGIRLGEILAFGAGTGVGKTDFFTQQMAHMVEQGISVGVFALEQQVADTAKRIAGKLVGKTFHIPDGGWEPADLDAAWERLTTSAGRVFLYDSFGVNEWASIRSKIEYLHHTEGVSYFFLDHLTALAAGEEDERVALEAIMADMGSLVAKLNITIFLVSHLATPDGKPHEEGGRVTIRHFKGSRAIGFWSHAMFGLERDQQADDEAIRTTTTLRCLKDRYTGRATGKVMFLGYDQETGRLFETTDPSERAAEAHGFDRITAVTPDETAQPSDF